MNFCKLVTSTTRLVSEPNGLCGVSEPMLDTGATNNVIDPEEDKWLGLKTTRRSDTKIKIINVKPMRNIGWAWDVKTKVGGWQGELDFLIALCHVVRSEVGPTCGTWLNNMLALAK
ncbi:Asp_protease domain-containing protein [Cucumis melo var. makuwa]|uniref:Asp_protease domain-containing protein n=2 Tax=Cucumis melo TaxID=3656 RepID=A0A5D3E435_CUCMM|nr:Asp_protease domain-containing protein [Cucumis melo var. makuwa]TYK30045.1 Asp_protease domain-containing protein [Cucumis melo var. makuwa]